ncbi:hypothetical protein Pmar_PMAR006046 [Perkinsus marinus ATCC 50983]|uniref:Uncharacterized protein n=1 Tax=Perkinsus marinus (strain ATCC 50983 / TXsc) TaxID=423536 RepID=C5LA25_PERM5|nr:hypothetical protein Pmar_PMAR006046 [Perkinsus marinus ATCC 50983]EER06281.1 hypothetical protein Pmar_PMAR006046 [Perkinsus marinus ATCC 50983]|eukprot:XP_002774465.1 hypothetical protein Pmar_PMAR006046 [Perkinsus marinus ATCC 50983]
MMDTTTDEDDGDCDMMDGDSDDDDIDPAVLYGSGPVELGKNSNDLYEMCLDKQLLDAYNNAAANHRVPPSLDSPTKVEKKSTTKGVKFNTGGAVRFFDTDAELQDPCSCEFPIQVKDFDGQSCHHANYIGMSRAAAATAAAQQEQQQYMSTLSDYSSDELKGVAYQMSKPRGVWPRQ